MTTWMPMLCIESPPFCVSLSFLSILSVPLHTFTASWESQGIKWTEGRYVTGPRKGAKGPLWHKTMFGKNASNTWTGWTLVKKFFVTISIYSLCFTFVPSLVPWIWFNPVKSSVNYGPTSPQRLRKQAITRMRCSCCPGDSRTTIASLFSITLHGKYVESFVN